MTFISFHKTSYYYTSRPASSRWSTQALVRPSPRRHLAPTKQVMCGETLTDAVIVERHNGPHWPHDMDDDSEYITCTSTTATTKSLRCHVFCVLNKKCFLTITVCMLWVWINLSGGKSVGTNGELLDVANQLLHRGVRATFGTDLSRCCTGCYRVRHVSGCQRLSTGFTHQALLQSQIITLYQLTHHYIDFSYVG